MTSNLTQSDINAITNTLSSTRISTYTAASGFSPHAAPLEIYTWNALVSGAFFSSLHVCEVAVRNGVSGALERTYGPHWPWNSTFEGSLPMTKSEQFAPRTELIRARQKMHLGATGKVIAELKFAFWCHLLTRRYDDRIWSRFLRLEFPNIPMHLSVAQCRQTIFDDLDVLRKFRNRIAHHEPIFSRPLSNYHERVKKLVAWRCNNSSHWLATWELVTATLAAKP